MPLSILSIPPTIHKTIHLLSYEIFGQPLGTAPVVIINHALTGNSTIIGKNGWWNDLVGIDKTINTLKFTVIAFNIPGNGYDNFYILDYKSITTKQIAEIFWYGLDQLQVQNLFAMVGGSLGGAIGWEMILQQPNRVEKFFPIATHYKSNSWVKGNIHVQDSILNNSKEPLQDARKHAMLLYRNPAGINEKFSQSNHKIEDWLTFHGYSLGNRFSLQAYKLVNHLLSTIGKNVSEDAFEDFAKIYNGEIHFIRVNSDLLFIPDDQEQTYNQLKLKIKATSHIINSIHGHDAFLIEYAQLSNILKSHFLYENITKITSYTN